MEIRFLPKRDLLKLCPLKGTVCQLPPLLLGTENKLKVRKNNTKLLINQDKVILYEHEGFAIQLTFLRKNFISVIITAGYSCTQAFAWSRMLSEQWEQSEDVTQQVAPLFFL